MSIVSSGDHEFARRPARGFTIIEVLIVLAVTGALLLAAMLLINGRQRNTAFNQSIRNIQTELQQIINEVGSGYYPNNGNLSCDRGGPAGGTKLSAGTTEQGANVNCVFMSKVAQFAVGTEDPEPYNIYTLVGLRGTTVSPSVDLKTSKARVIASGTAAGDAVVPDAFETNLLQYGLSVSKMYYSNAAGSRVADIAAVGFTMNVSSLGDADGSQRVEVVAIPGTALHVSKATGVQQINDRLATIDSSAAGTLINPPGGVQICLNSGGTIQSGLISIGGSDRQGSVDLQIFNTKDCV